MALGSDYTKRRMFLIIPRRRECAKPVSESNSDLNKRLSWLLALDSVAGPRMLLLALASSTCCRIVERAAVFDGLV
jgi:hypothetical protein